MSLGCTWLSRQQQYRAELSPKDGYCQMALYGHRWDPGSLPRRHMPSLLLTTLHHFTPVPGKQAFSADVTRCGGLNEPPHSLRHCNTCIPVGSTLWRPGHSLLEGMCYWGQTWNFTANVISSGLSRFASHFSYASYLLSCPTARTNSSFWIFL